MIETDHQLLGGCARLATECKTLCHFRRLEGEVFVHGDFALGQDLVRREAAFGLARSGHLFFRAVIGLALGFTFFVADNFLMAMGSFGNIPPLLAAWAPFLLFFLIGETVLFRTEE